MNRRIHALLFTLLTCGSAQAAAPAAGAPADWPGPALAAPLAVHGNVIRAIQTDGWADVLVGLQGSAAPTAALEVLAASAASAQSDVLADLDASDFLLSKRYEYFALVAGRVSASGLAKLRVHPQVTAIDEDVWVYPLAAAASSLALAEAVPSIDADKVHELGIKGEGIGVAVLDTGIDNDHPDIEDAIVNQMCFSASTRSCAPTGLPRSTNAEDEHGHGTAVSAIVLGRGKVAPVGVAPEAKLIGVRVFRDQGGAPTQDIVDGLNWVVGKQNAHNIRIVNMSLGGGAAIGTNCDNQFGSVKQVFQTLLARNVAIFVATGNGGNHDRVAFPACISNSTGVGSTWDAELRLASADCHGNTEVGPTDITCYTDRGRAMDMVAPGSVIVTARMGGGATAGGHGTSYASPAAAGVAALVLSADPSIHARDLERHLLRNGDIVIHPERGDEVIRVNALKAVMAVLPVTPTPSPTTSPTSSATPTDGPSPTVSPTSDAPTVSPEPSESPTPNGTDEPEPEHLLYLPKAETRRR